MNTLQIFTTSILFIHLAYLATFVGFASFFNETYVHHFNIFIQLIVCVFLIVRFSPFKKTYKLTKLDIATIFYCATFLLLNVVATEIYKIFFIDTTVVKTIMGQTK
jgi:hypothetical protein